jgi:uroporphyrin-III C-methyltransferase
MRRRVKLVGAGPGDADLITVKGLKAIQNADVILYDALVNTELLSETKKGAELIYVGKRAGSHSFTQDEINLKIVQSALSYKEVVRLKGGDPFIFGRGHEEAEYLENFDLEVEIIPGLSSSTSLAGLQNVPLTKRGVSESFWVLTGTTSFGKLSKDVELALQSSATLVILMGIKKLSQIVELLKSKDKGCVPIMIIQNGSLKNERFIVSDANGIVEKARKHKIEAPGIIVIGEVVSLHPDYVINEYRRTWIQL